MTAASPALRSAARLWFFLSLPFAPLAVLGIVFDGTFGRGDFLFFELSRSLLTTVFLFLTWRVGRVFAWPTLIGLGWASLYIAPLVLLIGLTLTDMTDQGFTMQAFGPAVAYFALLTAFGVGGLIALRGAQTATPASEKKM